MINNILSNKYLLVNSNGMKIPCNLFKTDNKLCFISDSNLKKIIIGFFIKKGMKKVALNNLNNSFLLIRKYFFIDGYLLLRLFVSRSISVLTVNKYIFGKKEKFVPRFNYMNKSIKYVLRLLVSDVMSVRKTKLEVSFVDILLKSCLLDNKYLLSNKQQNELSRVNKYVLLNGLFKKNKKVKLFRKVK